MNKNLSHTACGLLFAGMCALGTHSFAQVTAVTESAPAAVGTVTEFTPASETLVLKTETSPEPVRYAITRETAFVDETGAPVAVEKVTSGIPIRVRYVKSGDRLVASQIVVRRAAPVVEERTTTTTETHDERPVTHEEKEQIEKARHEEKERLERERRELKKAEER